MKILSFDGYTFGTDLKAYLLGANSDPYAVRTDLVDRGHRYPDFGDWVAQGRRLELEIVRPNGSTLNTRGKVKEKVGQIFRVRRGVKVLQAQHPVSGATLVLNVQVEDVQPGSAKPAWVYVVHLLAADPDWKATADTGPVSGPTLTNTGGTAAPVVVRLTPSNSGPFVYRQRVTVQDVAGNGLGNYPVRATFATNDIGLTGPSDFMVIYNSMKIPFNVTGVGTAATNVDLRMDVDEASASYADIYYSAYIQNAETANTLDMGQLDPSSGSYSNTTRVWGAGWRLTGAPGAAAAVWTPILYGNTVEGTSFGITAEGGGSVVISVRPDATLASNANGIQTVLGSAAAASNALTNLSRALSYPTLAGATNATGTIAFGATGSPPFGSTIIIAGPANTGVVYYDASAADVQYAVAGCYAIPASWVSVVKSGSTAGGLSYAVTFGGEFSGTAVAPMTLAANNLPGGLAASVSGPGGGSGGNVDQSARASVLYRKVGEAVWRTAWSSSSAGTVTAAIDVPGAVAIAVILEPVNVNAHADLTISGAAQLALNTATDPDVSVSARATAFLLNGTVTNSTTGQTLTLTDVYMDADTLVIDPDAGRIYTAGGTDWYGLGPMPSDAQEWFAAEVGANTVASSFWVPAAGGVGTTPSVVAVTYAWRNRYPLP